jgi:hypothetical protein
MKALDYGFLADTLDLKTIAYSATVDACEREQYYTSGSHN